MAAKTTPNKQNKPRKAPAKTPPQAPPTRTERRPPGGTHDDNPRPAPPHHAQPSRRTGTNTACPTMRGATHWLSTPHHEGGHAAKEHGRPCGGPHASTTPALGGATHRHNTPHSGRGARTNTARPTMAGATHQHSKPQQEGGHAPAQHQPRPSKQHSPNRNPTGA